MRLLKRSVDGDLSLTEDLADDDIPRYAILSHRWGPPGDEVMLEDMLKGIAKKKNGYKKIRFCGEQAARNGLQHFWVDTCCIDKTNSVELQEAINSMFRWYQNAARCYVYLSDVPECELDTSGQSCQQPWESYFRNSIWFTRGWTLQELIAPKSVEFFSEGGVKLGSKESLEEQIREITGIPVNALQGSPLSHFSVTERMSWAETRETTRKEDKAYSLLGIFGVHMPLIYGERGENALKRLREEVERASKGRKFEGFSLTFSLSDVSEIEHFVARKKELTDIHSICSRDGSRHIAVLQGLGGMGKTQLAVAYAKRHKDNYSAVFWLNIKDEESLKQSFAKMAKRILREHPSAPRLSSVDGGENLEKVVDAVKAWLSLPENTRWLLIYDNYDNPKFPANKDPTALDVRKFFPESYQGSIIITTRSSQVKIGRRIQVRKLEDIYDSLEILSSTSGRDGLINDPDAVRLVRELDGLPLALATAGAYLDQVAISFSDYLRLYKTSWLKLQETSPKLNSYEDRTLYSTWQLSFEHVKQQNELSAKLLQLWAYFDNQDVWFELLCHCASNDPKWVTELTEDEMSFNSAVRVLCDHGLVEPETSSQELIESRGYSMHGCVHSWTIDVLNQKFDHGMARLAVEFVGSHVPDEIAGKWWPTGRRLLQHAGRCSSLILGQMALEDGIEFACFNFGNLYRSHSKLQEAEKMFKRALLGYEKALGPDHTSTLATVNNLGGLYVDQGKLEEAEKMYKRALQGNEKVLGSDHTSTLDTVNNLGGLYVDQGKLEEAEKMYKRALLGYEKVLGPDYTSTLDTVNNLGVLYGNQGKLEEAEKMYKRALLGYEKVLGPDYTSTLDTVNNLGVLYGNQGKLEEAEKMYKRALLGYEKVLGPDYTSTLDTVNNLGVLYGNQGKLEEAEKMYKRALLGYEKVLGPDYTSTLDTVNNLGVLYGNQGKLEEAENMYKRALLGYEKVLGPDYTSTLDTVNNLGVLYGNQGKLEEAEKMYNRALLGYEKVLGPDHISTLETVNNLGILYENQDKPEEAEKMYKQALLEYEKALGREQLNCYIPALDTMENYGLLLVDTGSLDQAKELLTQTLFGSAKVQGLSSERCQRLTAKLKSLEDLRVAEGQPSRKKRRRFKKS